MKRRVEEATKLGVPSEARSKHNGFSQWDSYSSPRDHDTILQVHKFLNFLFCKSMCLRCAESLMHV